MPFDIHGVWVEPTEDDLIALKTYIETPEDTVNRFAPMPTELVNELNAHRLKVLAKKSSNKVTLASLRNVIRGELKPVDIILPVYGALPLVEACVNALLDRTWYPYKLTIIDDASPDPMVKTYLNKLELQNPEIRVLYNKKNKGFAGTVNRGILNSVGHYICILNSDVTVTEGWLTKMVMALEADPKNQIVNPCTNNTALIGIPMAQGLSYLDMNDILEVNSDKRYPEVMPTGFCFMFRRKLTDLIGMLDEGYGSYGEESDFWFKTIRSNTEGVYNNYRAVLADDAYVFHERGSSFAQLGGDEHMGIRKTGNDRFHLLNPDYSKWASTFDTAGAIGPVKNSVSPEVIHSKSYKYNIAWVVNSTAFCGGMKYIADIVNSLIEDGVNAKVVCIPQNPQQARNVLPSLHTQPVFYDSEEEFLSNFSREVFSEGILVASVGQVVDSVKKLAEKSTTYRTLHHIQSYDPIIAEFTNPDRVEEMNNSLGVLDHTICSSKWAVKYRDSKLDRNTTSIVPGVETELFHPRQREAGDERRTVMVYMNNDYNFRGYDRGVELCKALWETSRAKNEEIRILAVGCLSVPECPYVIGLGKLNPGRFAQVLGTEVDVFIDPAHVHSYGLPCLEALACGARAVSWMNGGVNDYAEYFKDSLVVLAEDTPADVAAKTALVLLLEKPRIETVKIPKEHTRRESIKSFCKELDELFQTTMKGREVEIVTPHLRKHGGPSTIVNLANIIAQTEKVELVSLHDDFNQELLNAAMVPINVNWKNDEKKGDLIIVNSDNPYSDYFAQHKGFKHKVLLKLSHNARFKALEEKSLNQDWDLIMTSSEWLREACLVKQPGWDHKEWAKEKVRRVGWYHYSHHIFDCGGVSNREYGTAQSGTLKVGILVHQHPLKGSGEAMKILTELRKIYRNNIQFFGVGEVKSKVPSWFQYFKSLNRSEMAKVFGQADIWINCSHTEGLGRMMLEAMSAGACVVATDTGAEFLKADENALLFPVGDPDAGLKQVKKVIEDVEIFKKLVVNGYNTAVKHSSPWEYSEHVHKALKGVFNGK